MTDRDGRDSSKDPKTVALLRLKDWLESGRRLPVRDTAKKLNVTRRTFQRYIRALMDMGVALDYEELESRERVYFVPFTHKRLRLDISQNQVVALNVALGWLDQFEGNVLFQSLEKLRERLSRWLAASTEAEGERWFSQKFFALPFLPYRYRSEGDAFNDVVTALLWQKKLELGYRSATEAGSEAGAGGTDGADGTDDAAGADQQKRKRPKRPKRHKVRPYTLVFYKGAFYLVAVRDEVADWGDPTVWSLARMSGTKVLRSEPYDYPENWEPSQAFHRMTGMLPGKRERVEALFDARFYDYLKKERRWPRGTKITPEKKGVRFAAKLALNDELLNWFLGFGPDVTLVEPKWFRDRLADKARNTAAVYK